MPETVQQEKPVLGFAAQCNGLPSGDPFRTPIVLHGQSA